MSVSETLRLSIDTKATVLADKYYGIVISSLTNVNGQLSSMFKLWNLVIE